jgi:hypothetical protein
MLKLPSLPRLPRLVARPLLYRRVTRDLARIADALDRQTALLARLADRFAPILLTEAVPGDRARLARDTGVSHLDQDEAAAALAYVERMEAATGHTPDEEEIVLHLGDEATTTLGERLEARELELARLMESRR